MTAHAEGFDGPTRDFEFTTNPVVGLRGFKVDPAGRLTGLHVRQVYRPGVNTATCDYCDTDRIGTCSCGFYAYFDGDARDQEYLVSATVGAVVRGYGRTVVGTRGFRASRSDLVALFPLRDGEADPLRGPSPFRALYPSYRTMGAVADSAGATVLWGTLFFGLLLASLVTLMVGLDAGDPVASLIGGGLLLGGGPWTVGWIRRVNLATTASFQRLYGHRPQQQLARLTRGAPDENKKFTGYHQADESQVFARLRVLYPDVPIYRSRKAALKALPLSRAEDFGPPEPRYATPETDPEFWDRDLATSDATSGVTFRPSSSSAAYPPTIKANRGGIHFNTSLGDD